MFYVLTLRLNLITFYINPFIHQEKKEKKLLAQRLKYINLSEVCVLHIG